VLQNSLSFHLQQWAGTGSAMFAAFVQFVFRDLFINIEPARKPSIKLNIHPPGPLAGHFRQVKAFSWNLGGESALLELVMRKAGARLS
jgi:hypothetical protein